MATPVLGSARPDVFQGHHKNAATARQSFQGERFANSGKPGTGEWPGHLPGRMRNPVLWPAHEGAVPVLLVSAHGPLYFAATLALSALLKTKNIFQTMLPEDTIAPGKFPQIDMSNVGFVCLCYLTAPSDAKHSCVLRRLTPLVKDAQVLSVTWAGSGESGQLLSPASAVSLLPGKAAKPEDTGEAVAPALAHAVPA